jgi:hypothetical protein
MKKVLILLLAITPLFAFSQDRVRGGDAGRGDGTRTVGGERGISGERGRTSQVHIEFLLQEQGGRTTIRGVKEDNMRGIADQPDLMEEISDITTRNFGSVAELFNVTSSLGWSLATQYSREVKGQTVTHFILSKPAIVNVANMSGRKSVASGKPASGAGAGAGAKGGTPQGRGVERK